MASIGMTGMGIRIHTSRRSMQFSNEQKSRAWSSSIPQVFEESSASIPPLLTCSSLQHMQTHGSSSKLRWQ